MPELKLTGKTPNDLIVKQDQHGTNRVVKWITEKDCYALVFVQEGLDTNGRNFDKLHRSEVFLVTSSGSQRSIDDEVWDYALSQIEGYEVGFEYAYILICLDGGKLRSIIFSNVFGSVPNEEGTSMYAVGRDGERVSEFDFEYQPSLGNEVETYSELVALLINQLGASIAQQSQAAGPNWNAIVDDLRDASPPDEALMHMPLINKPRIIVRR